MAKVERNLTRMAEMGAPKGDVDAYMKTEGVNWGQLRQFDSVKQSQTENQERPNVLERFGRGMTDIATGIGQVTGMLPTAQAALSLLPGGVSASAAPELFQQTDQQAQAAESADVARYEDAAGPGMDWARIAGQAAATAPLGAPAAMTAKAGLLGRAALGAAGGGSAGLLTYADSGGERLANTASGAIGGGLFAGIAPAVARGGGRVLASAGDMLDSVKSSLQALNAGKFTATITRSIDDAAERAGIPLEDIGESYTKRVAARAAAALKNGEDFDYDGALRQARAEKFGFVDDAAITRGQATRDPRIFSTEKNLSKRPEGAAIAERYNAQLAQAEKYMDDLAKATDLDPVTAGEGLRLYSKAQADAMQDGVRELYNAVPRGGSFNRFSLANRTDQILDDFEDSISSGVKRRIRELADTESTTAFTADELFKLDRLISDTMPPNPTNPAVGTAAGKLKEALLGVMDDAADSAGKDQKAAYRAAKEAAAARFKAIGPHGGLVSQLVHGTIDPTRVVNKVVGGGIDDLRRLKDFLRPEDWTTVQQSVENFIVENARPGGEFSQAAYDRAIKRVGTSRLKEIFGADKARELVDFRDAARDIFRFPNLHTVNTSNTAAEGANIVSDMAGGLLDLAPGGRLAGGLISAASKGGAARRAERETMELVAGLLANRPPLRPRANPAEPLLPLLRGAAPAAGLATAGLLSSRGGR